MISKETPLAKVLIVDDHPIVREGLVLRISRQPGMEVVGEAGD
jgi:DNA-binding NarL/FixJ family response regulator